MFRFPIAGAVSVVAKIIVMMIDVFMTLAFAVYGLSVLLADFGLNEQRSVTGQRQHSGVLALQI
jgi:hypothetical protein